MPTITPLPTESPAATEEPAFTRVTVPYWLSLSYPREWVPLVGENEGILGFGTHRVALDPSELPDSGAFFFVRYQQTNSRDPVPAARTFIESLDKNAKILTRTRRTTVAGMPAAEVIYSWQDSRSRDFVIAVSFVADDEGRMAAVFEVSEEERRETFSPIFAQIRETFAFEEMLPAPGLTDVSLLADDYVPYDCPLVHAELMYPSSWMPYEEPEEQTLYLLTPAALSQPDGFNRLIISPITEPTQAVYVADGPTTLLENAEQFSFSAAAPASPFAVVDDGQQQVALRYYSLVWEQKPMLILLAAVVRDTNGLLAMSIMEGEDYRADMEAVILGIIINTQHAATRPGSWTVDWSPDGQEIAFTSGYEGPGGIYIMTLADGMTRRLTNETEDATYADWSANGEQIVYSARIDDSGRHLFVRNADGSGYHQLTNEPGTDDSYPDWSPDGSAIIFARYHGTALEGTDVDAEILVLDVQSGRIARPLNVRGMAPSYSPDGTRIAFVSDLNGTQDIYVMNADGSNIVQTTDDADFELWPAWSPNGERLAFSLFLEDNVDLFVIDADGSNRQRLTDDSAPDYAPAWSPDGERIAFDSNREGNLSIYVVDADGTNLVKLTETSR